MKENKFRAKSAEKDKWVYGNLFMGHHENGIPYAVILTDKGYKVEIEDKDSVLAFRREEVEIVLPSTVCQYVGLKDKHGVEIYEGDIVSYDDKTGIVKWDAALTGFCIHEGNCWFSLGSSNDLYPVTVIGNIYDNPELVPQGDKEEAE